MAILNLFKEAADSAIKVLTLQNSTLQDESEQEKLDHEINSRRRIKDPFACYPTPAHDYPTNTDHPLNPKFDTRFQGGAVRMMLHSVIHPKTLPTWQGEMDIYTKDLTSLMKNGLYWSEANVEKDSGCIMPPSENIPPEPRGLGWMFARRYILQDLGEEPQWRASLWIYGRSVSELSRIQLNDLSVKNVRRAKAVTLKLGVVYEFNSAWDHRHNYNLITRYRPLKGWWPWPKAIRR